MTPICKGRLRRTLEVAPLMVLLLWADHSYGQQVMREPFAVLSGLKQLPVVRFSPDGTSIALWEPFESSKWVPRKFSNLRVYRVVGEKTVQSFSPELAGFEFSPDSQLVVTWDPKQISVTQLANAKLLATLPIAATGSIYFSKDGKLLIACTTGTQFPQLTPATMTFWDTATWKRVETKLDALFPLVFPTFSPDRQVLAAFVFEDIPKLKAWDFTSGKELFASELHNWGLELGLGFSRDGKLIAINSRVSYDSSTGKRIGFERPLSPYLHIVWNPDCMIEERFRQRPSAKAVLPVGDGKKWGVWDVASRKELAELENTTGWRSASGIPITQHSNFDRADSYQVFENDTLAVHHTAANTGALSMWNVATVQRLAPLAVDRPVKQIALDGAGKRIAVLGYRASHNGQARQCQVSVWDLDSRTKRLVLEGHNDSVGTVAVSLDGKLLATGSNLPDRMLVRDKKPDQRGELILWDGETGKLLHRLAKAGGPGCGLAFRPDGKQLASGGVSDDPDNPQDLINLWNTTSGKLDRELRVPPRKGASSQLGSVRCLAYSFDGKYLAVRSGDLLSTNISLWDLPKGELVFMVPRPGILKSLRFSPDQASLVLDGDYFDLKTRKIRIGGPFQLPLQATAVATHGLNAMAYCHGEGIANDVELWHLGKKAQVAILSPEFGHISCVAFTPDGATLIAGGERERSTELTVVDLPTGRELFRAQDVTHPEFSPDGRYVVTRDVIEGCYTLTLWEPRKGKKLATFPRQRYAYAAFSPDGKTLATVGHDEVQLWKVPDSAEPGQ